MSPLLEQDAREQIDELLEAAGWSVQDKDQINIHAARGVAIREFPLPGYGFADYLLYIDGSAAGVIETMTTYFSQCLARYFKIPKFSVLSAQGRLRPGESSPQHIKEEY